MHQTGTGRRLSALIAAFVAATVAAASVPTAGWAQQQGAASKPTKAPAASASPNKKSVKPTEDEAKRAEARQHFDEAEAKLAAGDFAAAYAGYKAANDTLPAPLNLFKMATALDKAGKAEEAAQAYGAYLAANAGDETKAAEAQNRVAELKRAMPIVVIVKTSPPGASVAIDGQPGTGVTPLEVKLSPGTHAFHFTMAGYDALDRQASVNPDAASVDAILSKSAPASSVGASTAPTEQPPPAPAVEADQERRSNTTAYVLLGITAACVGVGTVFGIKALQAKSDFDNGLRTSDQADTTEQYALISDLVFGTALTLGVTGAVLLSSNASRPQAAVTPPPRSASAFSPRLSIVPSVGPHHAAAAAKVQF